MSGFKIHNHTCGECSNTRTMNCPNSSLCYDTKDKEFYKPIKTFKGDDTMNKHYGCLNMLFDIFMTVITSGLWLIWVLIKYLRTH